MKRHFLNKFGTSFISLGSLGVGFCLGTMYQLSDLQTSLNFKFLSSSELLVASFVVLFIGLILRIRDLMSRSHKIQDLEHVIDNVKEIALLEEQHVKEIEEKLTSYNKVLDAAIERVVEQKVLELFKEKEQRLESDNTQ